MLSKVPPQGVNIVEVIWLYTVVVSLSFSIPRSSLTSCITRFSEAPNIPQLCFLLVYFIRSEPKPDLNLKAKGVRLCSSWKPGEAPQRKSVGLWWSLDPNKITPGLLWELWGMMPWVEGWKAAVCPEKVETRKIWKSCSYLTWREDLSPWLLSSEIQGLSWRKGDRFCATLWVVA